MYLRLSGRQKATIGATLSDDSAFTIPGRKIDPPLGGMVMKTAVLWLEEFKKTQPREFGYYICPLVP